MHSTYVAKGLWDPKDLVFKQEKKTNKIIVEEGKEKVQEVKDKN